MSRLSWQVKLPKGLLCTYCANSQSAVWPEVPPRPTQQHAQTPKLLPPGVRAVPEKAVCQFSLPYANAGLATEMASSAASPTPTNERRNMVLTSPCVIGQPSIPRVVAAVNGDEETQPVPNRKRSGGDTFVLAPRVERPSSRDCRTTRRRHARYFLSKTPDTIVCT